MVRSGWGFACVFAATVILGSRGEARAAEVSFPYGTTWIFNVASRPGIKDLPSMTVANGGATSFKLWCHIGHAQAAIGAATLTFTPQPAQAEKCTQALQSADEDLLSALAMVSSWSRSGDTLTLTGGPAPIKLTQSKN